MNVKQIAGSPMVIGQRRLLHSVGGDDDSSKLHHVVKNTNKGYVHDDMMHCSSNHKDIITAIASMVYQDGISVKIDGNDDNLHQFKANSHQKLVQKLLLDISNDEENKVSVWSCINLYSCSVIYTTVANPL